MKEFLKIFGRESLQELILILFVSIVSGILGGLLVPLVLEAAQNMVAGQWHAGYLIGLLVLTVVLLITKGITQHFAARLSEKTLAKLQLQFLNHIRQAELAVIEQHSRSDIFLAIVNAQDVTNAVMKAVNVFQLLLSLIVSWLYIVWVSPLAGFLILIGYVIDLGGYKVFRALTHDAILAETEKHQALFNTFQHILQGFKEVKINPQKNADLFERYLLPLIGDNQRIRTKTAFYFSEYHLFTDICGYAVMGSLALLLPSFGLQEVVAIIFAMIFYQGKLILVLLAQLPDIIKGQIALSRLRQLTQDQITRQPIRDTLYKSSKERIKPFRTLTLQNIQFAYPTPPGVSGFSLGPINLTARAGEILFIIGGNGSGKTTLMQVLTGLYRPLSGTFSLDDRIVKMTDYRHYFAAVFNDVHLFERLYGLDRVDEQQVNRLLAQMDLAPRVRYVDDRFSTLKLSAGQRKRLALVVSLLEDKPIYLFDEWAADQAPDFRRYFYQELLPALKAQGKTLIVVSHDERYFAVADRVIKMEYGQIKEA